VVYAAVRAALDLAELYRIGSMATYLMGQHKGLPDRLTDEVTDALCVPCSTMPPSPSRSAAS
jgi:hypothetical protein